MSDSPPLPASVTPSTTLYFAYGSNLSATQMRTRCPSSSAVGVARVRRARWFISARGYANVVPLEPSGALPAAAAANVVQDPPASNQDPHPAPDSAGKAEDEVWGLVYALAPADEPTLDACEGVPQNYGKEWLSARVWPLAHAVEDGAEVPAEVLAAADPFGPGGDGEGAKAEGRADVGEGQGWPVKVLMYMDRLRVVPGGIQQEYVLRMQRGMLEAGMRGVPKDWMESVIGAAVAK